MGKRKIGIEGKGGEEKEKKLREVKRKNIGVMSGSEGEDSIFEGGNMGGGKF